MHIINYIFYIFKLFKTRCRPLKGTTMHPRRRFNTFTHADGYSRHVEFAQNAQHQFFYLVLERIKKYFMDVYICLKKHTGTIKSDNVYRRHAAFGPYEV